MCLDICIKSNDLIDDLKEMNLNKIDYLNIHLNKINVKDAVKLNK